MSTVSQTQTTSTTVSVTTAHVAETLQNVTTELSVIAAHLTCLGAQVPDVDLDHLLVDLGIFILFGCLRSVSAQLIVDGHIWMAWEYVVVADRPLSQTGPSPDNPPVPRQVPPHARLRIVVDKAPGVSEEEFDERLAARGWGNAAPVEFWDGMVARQYGTYANAGFAVERVLHALPDAFEQQARAPRQGQRQ